MADPQATHPPDQFEIAEDEAGAATAVAEPPFTREELRQFDADDVEAGKNLCKMLSLFFFYTVLVMGLSAFITWKWVTAG